MSTHTNHPNHHTKNCDKMGAGLCYPCANVRLENECSRLRDDNAALKKMAENYSMRELERLREEVPTLRAEITRLLSTLESCRAELDAHRVHNWDWKARAEQAEAREKAKDERIRELEGALGRAKSGLRDFAIFAAKSGTVPNSVIQDLLSAIDGLTPSPSQPVKVAEEKRGELKIVLDCNTYATDDGRRYCRVHDCYTNDCPPAEKLTGTGEGR